METLVVIVVVVVLAVGGWLWWRRRNALPPAEDEWELPPEPAGTRPPSPPVPQILDRDAVLGRNRTFDPSRWDNSPDGSGEDEPEPGDLPRYLDRDYLRRKDPGDAAE